MLARPRSLQAVRGDAEEAIKQRVTQPGIGIASRMNGALVEQTRASRHADVPSASGQPLYLLGGQAAQERLCSDDRCALGHYSLPSVTVTLALPPAQLQGPSPAGAGTYGPLPRSSSIPTAAGAR